MAKSTIKPKKAKLRLEARILEFERSPGIAAALTKAPGSFTKPGSVRR